MNNITNYQKRALDTLRCERISADEGNLRDVEIFKNTKNELLVETLKGKSFEDDENKGIAYYLIKDSEGMILCYFSVKAGLLFDKHGDLEILQSKKALNLLIKKKQSLGHGSEEFTALRKDLENEIETIKNRLRKWIELDASDEKHKRVGKTFSGIEIVHFCVNETALERWQKFGFGEKNRIGITVFWSKIVPLVLKARELIGVDYLYLFAADTSEDRNLINHYKAYMSLEEAENIFAALPIYDMGCTLLCQKIDILEEQMNEFFENFNSTLEMDLT